MRSEINGAQIVLGILTAALGVCVAQPGPYRVGNGVTAPQVVKRTEPVYPEEARKAAVDGYVRVMLVVDSEGNPSGLKVSPPLGFGLDEAALQAVASWKFQPGMKDGIAVAVETSVNVAFQLPDQPNALHMQRFACKVPEGAPRPVVINSPYPSLTPTHATVSASISLDVDALGVPHDPRLINLTDAQIGDSIMAAIREWRFQPGAADEKPVASNCILMFALGQAPPLRIGGGVTSPRIITKVEPQYSDEARRAKYEGTVVLSVIVDDRGTAREVKVRRGIGLGLDDKAIESVNQWQFQPGMKDGSPVAVSAVIEVNFRVLKKPSRVWHSENFSFRPGAATRPQFVRTKFPAATDTGDYSVTVSFEVGELGKPVNLRVDKSSDEKWNQKVLDAVKEWRFEPGVQNGNPVAVPCTVTVAIGN